MGLAQKRLHSLAPPRVEEGEGRPGWSLRGEDITMRGLHRILFIVGILTAIAANANAQSSRGWQGFIPAQASDATYIVHNLYGVYNSDTVSSRVVVTDLGITNATLEFDLADRVISVTIDNSSDPASTACYGTAVNVQTGAMYAAFARSSTLHVNTMSVSFANNENVYGIFAIGLYCVLPTMKGSAAHYILGASINGPPSSGGS